jgi:phosphatidylinositol alpha 1,6-mannosyltransferase
MRVGIVAESFLPHVNGVTNSILRTLEHLERRGHDGVVLAPASRHYPPPASYAGTRVYGLPSLPMPRYPQVRISLGSARRMAKVLGDHGVDVVHLASPFFTGLSAVRAAGHLGVPVIASYQTDAAAFVSKYGAAVLAEPIWRRLRAIHQAADVNLAPSRAAMEQLDRQRISRVHLLPRGVDTHRFSPRHRSPALRAHLAPRGEVLVGFVGRLAPEKCVEDLGALQGLPGVRIVIIGDGPDRARLERLLPHATFLGFLQGRELGQAVATLDVGVHPGPHETFCQSVQEVLASGVPVVAVGAGGPLDLVQPSCNGWLYPPGDAVALRECVKDLAGDVSKARAMGRRAREGVLSRTWVRVGDELVDHYRRLTEASRADSRSAA